VVINQLSALMMTPHAAASISGFICMRFQFATEKKTPSFISEPLQHFWRDNLVKVLVRVA
jgi:hypothetical protein